MNSCLFSVRCFLSVMIFAASFSMFWIFFSFFPFSVLLRCGYWGNSVGLGLVLCRFAGRSTQPLPAITQHPSICRASGPVPPGKPHRIAGPSGPVLARFASLPDLRGPILPGLPQFIVSGLRGPFPPGSPGIFPAIRHFALLPGIRLVRRGQGFPVFLSALRFGRTFFYPANVVHGRREGAGFVWYRCQVCPCSKQR